MWDRYSECEGSYRWPHPPGFVKVDDLGNACSPFLSPNGGRDEMMREFCIDSQRHAQKPSHEVLLGERDVGFRALCLCV